MSTETSAPKEEQHQFSAEVERLMDLVVHALYSEREIFLRELIANSADAMDRRRFEALTNEACALPATPQIRLSVDKEAHLLTISDDGVGMSKEEIIQNLGTIARSGTRAFEKQLKDTKPEDRPNLIGQFGVGFYSAFMVADKVEVISRRAGTDEAWSWTSEGKGQYTLTEATRETAGTTIILHIKSDADEYLESMRLENIIRKWADHIAWPIAIKQGDEEERNANEGTALWRKPRSEITDEQLEDFYRHITHLFDKPLATLLWHAEGVFEFTSLLFIPGMISPFEPVDQERKSKVRLHVRRMFITDEAEMLPAWLRFIQGIVDTEDLPLNVSREMLQNTPVLARIRKALTNRVMSELTKLSEDEEKYKTFWNLFGAIFKEGLWENGEHSESIIKLSRFYSSTEEGFTTLPDYVSRMKENQEAIYYLAGDSKDILASSPQLEGFKAQGIEVLLFTDAVDAFWPDRVGKYSDKPLRSITQAKEDLEKLMGNVEHVNSEEEENLLKSLKGILADKVTEVRTTQRLVDSPVILAASAGGPDLQMQRLMRRNDKTMPSPAPVLELNPNHPWIKSLVLKAKDGKDISEEATILLDLARVQDGEMPVDPTLFARRIATALTGK
ncbi:HSP90 family (HtpG) (PDB:1Y4S) (PUBMED:30150682) [Commensalibacter communis]|uniref:molecular chaperone HtpG n=1 Tax=Commensalibacter communis TaxID=2972786 RepID=UPI0022FF8025|nr:molecular chaperone HtpG [Commensalibacter communis]CAI3924930.1 HSP90 family (HtpG) (PDB:1Y4S) (PUBMED:30150682) [Commensalibacter communis]CAI3934212.1 HSP90 family (HtpG) (PDB:1Y4S) (PUBMED:30150682) [Commensalibacter communis]